LVKNQSTATENGAYNESSGAWTRTLDANEGTELETGVVKVIGGTVNAGTSWKQTTSPVTIGVSNIVWVAYDYVSDYQLYENNNADSTNVTYDYDFYFQPQVEIGEFNEIEDSFTSTVIGVDDLNDIQNIVEFNEGGTIVIGYDLDLYLLTDALFTSASTFNNRTWIVELLARINDEPVIIVDTYNLSESLPVTPPDPGTSFNLSGQATFDIDKSDLLYSYIRVRIDFNNSGSDIVGTWNQRNMFGGVVKTSTVTLTQSATFPDTQTPAFFINDVGRAITRRIIGDTENFYSEFFGGDKTIPHYATNGCGYQYLLTRGLQLRQYTLSEKPFFISFKDWWQGVNPIFNLGLGYETISGVEKIRVEEKGYFFDPTVILNFSYVNNIERTYDKDQIYKKIEVGYNKWKSEPALFGLDDPQTKHTYATLFEKIGKDINIYSGFIAASLAIENTRRTTRIKSSITSTTMRCSLSLLTQLR